jgi:choline dehydrogenase-like flavoprotein
MIRDPIAEGVKHGWDVRDLSKLQGNLHLEADVVIVGTGAGGGTAAEILSNAGLKVVMVEAGGLLSSSDFHMLEREAYPLMYQESGNRQTSDKGITILQGRTVGGSTTVNWTSSFRTPVGTLAYWRKRFGLSDYTPEALAPWFSMMERRLHVAPWALPPNENNAVLKRGAEKLGIATAVVPRNVKGCWNLGYCGLGCPTNAKQSMLVTTIPAALQRGATLLTHCRAERFTMGGNSINGLFCEALDERGLRNTPYTVTIAAKSYIAAGGSINTPALLLRSDVPNPHQRLGVRTFLHPVAVSAAVMPEVVDGFAGAPQTVYTDHFLETQPLDGPIGYKLEVPPIYPLQYGSLTQGFGQKHALLLEDMPHKEVMIALLRDGFNDQSEGGSVHLRHDHSPELDYPINSFVWDGLRRGLLSMAEIQFAAGAKTVMPLHESAWPYTSWSQARAEIAALPMELLLMRVVSAHVMGGCGMGSDERTSVVDGTGRHHQVGNLFVFDGSVFPTSIGANPQLSIYGVVARNATLLATAMTGR